MINNIPKYNWPEAKFARLNLPATQLEHIISEFEEARTAETDEEREMELADLHHSLETYWRIKAGIHGQEYVTSLFGQVEEKNRVRGYYDHATCQQEGGQS